MSLIMSSWGRTLDPAGGGDEAHPPSFVESATLNPLRKLHIERERPPREAPGMHPEAVQVAPSALKVHRMGLHMARNCTIRCAP
jgi:hypothetical protein